MCGAGFSYAELFTLDKGHMVAHGTGGEFGPNIFPQDRELNRGWSTEGKRFDLPVSPAVFDLGR